MEAKLISVKEAAELLGLKEQTVYLYKMLGTIPYVKIGRRVLFSPKKLEAFVEAHSHEPGQPKRAERAAKAGK